FFTLFAVLLIISAVILGLSLFVKSNTKAQKINNEHQSYNGVIIACVFFLATFCQGAVNSFLTSYKKELNFGNIGLFFTLMAIVTFISRFFSRKIQNIFGLKKLSFILSIIMAVSIALIAFIQNEFQLFLLAIPLGLSTGLLFPIFNYRIIQTVD